MALPAIAAGVGLASMFGGIARASMNKGFTVDPSGVRQQFETGPLDGPYGAEAASAEGRVAGIKNPYATGAMWDQEWARQQQQQHMDDLWATARGEKSLAREQGADTARTMQNMMMGSAAGASRFDTGARGEAGRQANLLPYGQSADVEVAAGQEEIQAQNMMQQLLAHRDAQDRAELGAWADLQKTEGAQALAGGQAGMDIARFGGARKRRRIGEEVGWVGTDAKAAANQ